MFNILILIAQYLVILNMKKLQRLLLTASIPSIIVIFAHEGFHWVARKYFAFSELSSGVFINIMLFMLVFIIGIILESIN
jgi:hypothetical protein